MANSQRAVKLCCVSTQKMLDHGAAPLCKECQLFHVTVARNELSIQTFTLVHSPL